MLQCRVVSVVLRPHVDVHGGRGELERARPVFEAMGKNIFHAGAAGAGQVAKMCNNMLLSVLAIRTAEAIQLAVANGLIRGCLRHHEAVLWRQLGTQRLQPLPGVMDNVPASRGYEGGFLVDLMIKDLGLAMDAAAAPVNRRWVRSPVRFTSCTRIEAPRDARRRRSGFSSIQRLFTD